ncbi:DUF222 domain-containing protein [Cryobacterium breve]|uniref:DUF222 domain-containing protein n=1 Tax=Cryobacterium breve TaxID=1259258 RepID=A0ABY7NBQ5_9MICO|nr:DUF222 domain-containing protein [Cryobacterium breve]WBM79025.1 DUF222 domain-containing protein [Cryobacterium breve]
MTTLPESPASPDQPHADRVFREPVQGGVLAGLRSLADVVTGLGGSSAVVDALTDEAVLEGQVLIAGARRALDTQAAWSAATLARRSRPELGGKGLAARKGYRSPEDLLQAISGSSKGDAAKLLAVGRLLAEADAAEKAAREAAEAQTLFDETPPLDGNDGPPPLDGTAPHLPPVPPAAVPPWHAPIGRALAEGWLSVEKADSLRKGLGDLDRAITPEKLASALARLLAESRTLNADQLFKRARRVRDVLDEAGIAAREKAAYDDRSLRFYRLHTGQVSMVGLFAPEDGEYLMQTYDAITSPRRGGVRFVDKEQAAWAKRVQDDPRTTEQLTADAFLALIKLGVKADPKRIAGGRSPAVRMVTIRPTGTAPTGTAPTGSSPVGPASSAAGPTGTAPAGASQSETAATGIASTGAESTSTAPTGTSPDAAAEPAVDAGAGSETDAPALQPGVIEGTAVTVSAETLSETGATAVSSTSPSTTTGAASTSAGNNAPSAAPNAPPSPFATAAACGPAATDHPPGPRPTTSTTGKTTPGRPTSTRASCSVGPTTSDSTTNTGESPATTPADTGSPRHPDSTPSSNPSSSPARTRSSATPTE